MDFCRIVYRDIFGGGHCLLVVRALAGGRRVAGSCFRTGQVVSLAGCILLSLVVSWLPLCGAEQANSLALEEGSSGVGGANVRGGDRVFYRLQSNFGAACFFALLRDPRFFFYLSRYNLVGNVYPIWLQRYNRIRVGRVMGRLTRLRPSS